jgi:Polyphosphate kinase 2 (PPK2)
MGARGAGGQPSFEVEQRTHIRRFAPPSSKVEVCGPAGLPIEFRLWAVIDRRFRRNMKNQKMKRKDYEKELLRLQAQLCLLQDWVKHKGLRVVIVFEGRDGAGKGD